MEYDLLPDIAASIAAFRTGNVDAIAAISDMQTVNSVLKINPDTYISKELGSAVFVFMNMGEKPFQDIRVRKAIAMGSRRP